jgi:myo-inositol-1(or 4)-monophosphatase
VAATDDQKREWLDFALRLAAEAQRIATKGFRTAEVMKKRDHSHVTAADFAIQRLMCAEITARFPDHAVVCEEEGDYLQAMPRPHEAAFCWVIDPLDGTRNYVRGLPCFATSIALMESGTPIVGVVRDLANGRIYTATRGGGARLADRLMRCATEPVGHGTIVAFQPADDGSTYDTAAEWLQRVNPRNLGSTALHLALIADGALDAGLCIECRVWDVAAAGLMVEEAGGVITGLSGRSLWPFDLAHDTARHVPFLAGGPLVQPELLQRLRRAT